MVGVLNSKGTPELQFQVRMDFQYGWLFDIFARISLYIYNIFFYKDERDGWID